MIELIVKSSLLLLLTVLAVSLLQRQSAGLVHRIWVAGLIAAMSVPLLNVLMPAWRIDGVGILGFDWQPSVSTEAMLLGVWIAGCCTGLTLLLAGAVRLGWLVYHAAGLEEPRWRRAATELSQALRLKRSVRLLVSDRVNFIGTWGVFKPRILLPATAGDWSDSRIQAVLAHELGHVARGDWALQILADAARAIYWFNPLFWLLARQIRRASEHSADDVALAMGVGRADYARELLAVAQELGPDGNRGPLLAMAQPSFLEHRLRAVLNPKLKRLARAPWATLVIVVLAVAVSVPLASFNADSGPAGTGDSAAATVLPSAYSCPVTDTVVSLPPDPGLAAAFGDGPWHVNDDRSIWVWAQPYRAGQSVGAIWIRPQGSSLSITTERLDADAPAAEVELNCCFPNVFKSGGIEFPTPGCWRVDAVAADRRLSFIVDVAP